MTSYQSLAFRHPHQVSRALVPRCSLEELLTRAEAAQEIVP